MVLTVRDHLFTLSCFVSSFCAAYITRFAANDPTVVLLSATLFAVCSFVVFAPTSKHLPDIEAASFGNVFTCFMTCATSWSFLWVAWVAFPNLNGVSDSMALRQAGMVYFVVIFLLSFFRILISRVRYPSDF